MSRQVFDVLPDEGGWKVSRQGATCSRHETKEQAIEAGRNLALAGRPSQLVVHNSDGVIETEWTYQDDPYTPPG